MIPSSRAFLVLAAIFTLIAPDASAQTPVITSAPSTVAAGPDYATDILANPWDFSDALDLSPFPDEFSGWTNSATTARTMGRQAFISNGRFAARTAANGGNLIPLLYRGGGVQSLNENTGHFDHKAIPTARYGKLSFSMTLSASTVGQAVAFWYSGRYGEEQGRGAAFRTPRAGTHIYTVDLVAGLWYDDRGNVTGPVFVPAGGFPQIAWNGTGLMRGLQLRATSDGAASVDVQVDWARVTQRDGQAGVATMPITFSGCPNRDYNVEVDAGGSWDIIHAGRAAGTSTTTALVNYGVLPPGAWRLRVACYPTTRASGTPAASPAVIVTINQPPIVTVHNPDAVGGSDFATDLLRNTWDMNALSDIAVLGGVTNAGITNDGITNVLQATSTSTGDPAVIFLDGRVGVPQVDTTRYRNLTFSLNVGAPFSLTATAGSVARVFWERPSGSQSVMTVSQDILVWPGRNVYTIDLAGLTIANGGLETSVPGLQQATWQATPAVRYFRVDPYEGPGATFQLGTTLLTEFDEVRLGSPFAVLYGFADSDTVGSSYETRIYIDVDRDRSAMSPRLDTLPGVAPNTLLTYTFDPAAKGVPAGLYYVYVEVAETRAGVTDVRGHYASGPLVVSSGAGGLQPPGPPTLTAVQTASNPVTVAWSPGSGGAPSNYTIVAGSAAGATNFGAFNLGLATQITANVPLGVRMYARVIASNAAGSTISNEISFVVGGGLAPGPPRMNAPIVSGRTVSLSWNPPSSGGAPSSYVLIARIVGNLTPIASLQLAATGVTLPGVPPGDFFVTVVAVNGAGMSPESNAIIVSVR